MSSPATTPKLFLIEEDNDSRHLWRNILKEEGYRLALSLDEESALERVEDCEVRADLMIISLKRQTPDEMLRAGRKIAQSGNLEIPIIAIPKKYGPDQQGRHIRRGELDYIAYPEQFEQLLDLIYRLTVPEEI